MSPGGSELMRLLWEATEVLYSAGVIMRDSSSRYVLRLLVLKLLSDMAEGTSASVLPKLLVPKSARWSQLQDQGFARLGERIYEACAGLEEANPSLKGLMKSSGFVPESLGARTLKDLLRTLSALPHLSGELVADGSLGEAVDGFLQRLAEASGQGYGGFYTPPSVSRLLVELLAPQEGMLISDPACGAGGLLAECARYVASTSAMRLPPAATTLVLHGQQRNAEMWAQCRMNLLLHGITDARIELGNALWDPPTTEQGELFKYDRILTNPPWNLGDWGAEQAAEDIFGRFNPVPPRNNANYAFVQHCLAALKEGGRAALLFPRGVLFRGGIEESIRRKLLEEDRFEAIIGLPGSILYGTGIPPVILVLVKGKRADRRNRVLFIDASEAGVKHSRVLRTLSQENIGSIVRAFQDFGGDPRFVRAAHLDEIRTFNWNLAVERYVQREEAHARMDLGEKLVELATTERQRDEAAQRMDDAIGRLKRSYPSGS